MSSSSSTPLSSSAKRRARRESTKSKNRDQIPGLAKPQQQQQQHDQSAHTHDPQSLSSSTSSSSSEFQCSRPQLPQSVMKSMLRKLVHQGVSSKEMLSGNVQSRNASRTLPTIIESNDSSSAFHDQDDTNDNDGFVHVKHPNNVAPVVTQMIDVIDLTSLHDEVRKKCIVLMKDDITTTTTTTTQSRRLLFKAIFENHPVHHLIHDPRDVIGQQRRMLEQSISRQQDSTSSIPQSSKHQQLIQNLKQIDAMQSLIDSIYEGCSVIQSLKIAWLSHHVQWIKNELAWQKSVMYPNDILFEKYQSEIVQALIKLQLGELTVNSLMLNYAVARTILLENRLKNQDLNASVHSSNSVPIQGDSKRTSSSASAPSSSSMSSIQDPDQILFDLNLHRHWKNFMIRLQHFFFHDPYGDFPALRIVLMTGYNSFHHHKIFSSLLHDTNGTLGNQSLSSSSTSTSSSSSSSSSSVYKNVSIIAIVCDRKSSTIELVVTDGHDQERSIRQVSGDKLYTQGVVHLTMNIDDPKLFDLFPRVGRNEYQQEIKNLIFSNDILEIMNSLKLLIEIGYYPTTDYHSDLQCVVRNSKVYYMLPNQKIPYIHYEG